MDKNSNKNCLLHCLLLVYYIGDAAKINVKPFYLIINKING